MGLSIPEMIKDVLNGSLPVKMLIFYLVIGAFMGTISLTVVLSLNAPFIAHTVVYTVMGLCLFLSHRKEKKLAAALKEWADSFPQ